MSTPTYYSDHEFIEEYGTEEHKQEREDIKFSADSGTKLRALTIDVATTQFELEKVIINIPPTTFEKISVFPISDRLEDYIEDFQSIKESQI